MGDGRQDGSKAFQRIQTFRVRQAINGNAQGDAAAAVVAVPRALDGQVSEEQRADLVNVIDLADSESVPKADGGPHGEPRRASQPPNPPLNVLQVPPDREVQNDNSTAPMQIPSTMQHRDRGGLPRFAFADQDEEEEVEDGLVPVTLPGAPAAVEAALRRAAPLGEEEVEHSNGSSRNSSPLLSPATMARRAQHERRLSRFVFAGQQFPEEGEDEADEDGSAPAAVEGALRRESCFSRHSDIPSFGPASEALHRIEDIENSEILTNARAMCHIASREETQWAEEFSEAVECYVQRDFDEAVPLLQAALEKARAGHDKKILRLMIQDCQGPRVGLVDGKHK